MSLDWGKDPANGLPYSGQSVQDFIKKMFNGKVGYWRWSKSPGNANYYHLWGFATKDDYTEYVADPDGNAALLLVDEALPISTAQGDGYGAYLFTTFGGSKDIVVSGDTLKVPLRFHSVRTSNGERLNIGVPALLIIQRSTDNGSTWTTVDTRSAAIPSTDYSDTETYTDINVANCLISGS